MSENLTSPEDDDGPEGDGSGEDPTTGAGEGGTLDELEEEEEEADGAAVTVRRQSPSDFIFAMEMTF